MTSGKDRIAHKFESLRERGEKGLVTYITAGYPSSAHTLEIVKALAEYSDLIELGIPFSDPIADGPVIQSSSFHALEGGIRQADIFELAEKIRSYTDLPLLFMTYYNPIFRAGIGSFVENAFNSGVDGLIVPDLPVEEDCILRDSSGSRGISLIPLAAPTSTDDRLEKIAAKASAFIYCISVTGVTGSRAIVNTDLQCFSDRVRRHTGIPLAVGFGISGPETARRAASYFDSVVVGSAIVKAVEGDGGLPGAIDRVSCLTRSIKEALRNACDICA